MTDSKSTLNHTAIADKLNGSVAENARKLGISRQHLNNIIKGRKQPSASLLLKIQKVYRLSADSLTRATRTNSQEKVF